MRTRAERIDRKFTTNDASLAIGAIVLGIAWATVTIPILVAFAGRFAWMYDCGEFLGYSLLAVRWSIPAIAALIAPSTIAVLILRLRSPRPSLRRGFRQPGTAACAVASIFLVLDVFNHFLNLMIRLDGYRLRSDFGIWNLAPVFRMHVGALCGAIALSMGETPGLAVAGAYLALYATGLWRPQPTWIDRTGRALGWFWILMALGLICLPIKN